MEDGDEMEGQADGKLAQKEEASLGETGNEAHGKLCLRQSRRHFFCLQRKWRKPERALAGGWYLGLFLWLRCLDLNL